MEDQNKNSDFHFDQGKPKKSKVPEEFWKDKPVDAQKINSDSLKSIASSLSTIKTLLVIYFFLSLFSGVIWMIFNLS